MGHTTTASTEPLLDEAHGLVEEGHGHSHGGHGHGGHGHSHGHDDEKQQEHKHEHEREHEHAAEAEAGHGHSHSGGSGGGHGHSHGGKAGAEKAKEAPDTARAKLLAAVGLCVIFMCAEVVGGYLANSLAIMTDAAHLMSDVAGLLINVFALWLAKKPPTANWTYGYHRVEVVGAMASVLIIWLLTGVLVYEAVNRILNPVIVNGKIMFIVATCGLIVNLAMMKVLHQGHGHSHGGHGHSHGGAAKKPKKLLNKAGDDHAGAGYGSTDVEAGGHGHSHGAVEKKSSGGHGHAHGESLSVKSAFIHAVGDLIQSIGVMVAAALIWWRPEYHIADPICTFLFSILVLITTLQILNQGMKVILDSVPDSVDQLALLEELETIAGVKECHDLHIWSIGSSKPSLSVHITVTDDGCGVLQSAQDICAKNGITHTTIQLEQTGTDDRAHCQTFGSCSMTHMRKRAGRPVAMSSPIQNRR